MERYCMPLHMPMKIRSLGCLRSGNVCGGVNIWWTVLGHPGAALVRKQELNQETRKEVVLGRWRLAWGNEKFSDWVYLKGGVLNGKWSSVATLKYKVWKRTNKCDLTSVALQLLSWPVTEWDKRLKEEDQGVRLYTGDWASKWRQWISSWVCKFMF